MDCKTIKFAEHAVIQMFKRNISTFEIEQAIKNGQVIRKYPEDRPYPSCLIFGFVDNKNIHVVLAFNDIAQECIIITAYLPDPQIWKSDYKTKK